MVKAPFELGVGHYDSAPPDEIDLTALERMRDDDRFRFANHLGAWIEVENGRIVDCGQWGEGLLSSTHICTSGPRRSCSRPPVSPTFGPSRR
jgi:hypothetical protein